MPALDTWMQAQTPANSEPLVNYKQAVFQRRVGSQEWRHWFLHTGILGFHLCSKKFTDHQQSSCNIKSTLFHQFLAAVDHWLLPSTLDAEAIFPWEFCLEKTERFIRLNLHILSQRALMSLFEPDNGVVHWKCLVVPRCPELYICKVY